MRSRSLTFFEIHRIPLNHKHLQLMLATIAQTVVFLEFSYRAVRLFCSVFIVESAPDGYLSHHSSSFSLVKAWQVSLKRCRTCQPYPPVRRVVNSPYVKTSLSTQSAIHAFWSIRMVVRK